ncbi:energy transducer TonB [Olleya sp. R77988]|uniref:energy transducer TonB n=1 Tax=Olleya sp. R77988 TaxID=3093875 RepID=UPI0037CA2D6B
MANYYSIKIPEPCHEGWDTMTPKDKGRFCGSCNKTVVDFTKMDNYQIQDYLQDNKGQRICGHIKQTQLDSINLRIPLNLIQQNHNVYKSFFFAVMIVMGTSLFSCSSKNGKPQKIDSIEVIDTTKNEVIDVLGMIAPPPNKPDSLQKKKAVCKPPKIHPPNPEVEGMMIIETTGEIITVPDPIKIDSLKIDEPIDIMGDIIFEEDLPTEPYPIHFVDQLPKFKNTPQNLSKEEEKKYFQSKFSDFVKANFETSKFKNLGIKGTQRIFVLFEIEKTGQITIKKIRAPHHSLENEAKRVFEKLPKFIPAKHDGKQVAVTNSLPIIFNAED